MTTPGSNGPDQQPGGGASGWGQPPAGPPGGWSPPPPPPPGGFPQGQYQPQPGGAPYPPQGGAPYPPQGGAPYPPQGASAHQPGGHGTPQRSGKPKWLIPVIAGVVGLLALGALLLFVFSGAQFEQGDCIRQAGENEVEEVDCDDSDAEARIVGVHGEELTESEFFADDSTCSAFPETVNQIWVAKSFGDDGTIYCTAPVA